MREYGKVHTSFWSSETIRGLPDDGKLLALYLMTCPHVNMSGVFRLPLAYATEDMGWDAERLGNGFKTLSDAGWAIRCDRTGWVWIRKWSEWNKADNPNQQKAIDKLLAQVPDSVAFKSLISPQSNFSETVSEPLGNLPVPVPVPVLLLEGEISIPLNDGSEYVPTADLLATLRQAFPHVDLSAELRKARAWSVANPQKKKSRRGVAAFLNTWMSNAPKAVAPATLAPAGGRRAL